MSDEITLKDWSVIYVPGFNYMLAGTADNDPKLGVNARVSHTSAVKSFQIIDDVAHVETQSDVYLCPLKYLDPMMCLDEPMGEEDNVIGDMGSVFDYVRYKLRPSSMPDIFAPDLKEFEHIDELRKTGAREMAAEKAESVRRMKEFAEKYEQCLYIELSSVSVGSPGVYNMDGRQGVIEPEFHVGIVSDRVCYTRHGVLDFRYWPYSRQPKDSQVYIWSDNLKHVFIKNLKASEITFNGQPLPSNTVTELARPDTFPTLEPGGN